MNLLVALPEWFTSWGWIVIVVAALIIIALVIFLIVRAKKGGAVQDKEEQPAEQTPVADSQQPEEQPEEEEGEDDGEDAEEAEPPVEDDGEEEQEQPAEEAPAATPEVKEEKAKPANKTYHVAKRKSDGKWQVKMAGGSKAIKLFNTQLEAIDFAKKLAENQEAKIVIHKEDGTFRRLTYHKKK